MNEIDELYFTKIFEFCSSEHQQANEKVSLRRGANSHHMST